MLPMMNDRVHHDVEDPGMMCAVCGCECLMPDVTLARFSRRRMNNEIQRSAKKPME